MFRQQAHQERGIQPGGFAHDLSPPMRRFQPEQEVEVPCLKIQVHEHHGFFRPALLRAEPQIHRDGTRADASFGTEQGNKPATRLGGLGLEPFDPAFTGEYLHRALRGRRVAIKQALLAGDIVVGAGNIYACEALFRAGVDPRTAAGRVSRPRCERLAEAVRHILAQALDLGGSTLRDYRDAHGMAGSCQQHAAVSGREGQPCLACGTAVRRIVQGQRSSFFCPHCQRR